MTNNEIAVMFVNGSAKCVHNGSMAISADGTRLLSYSTTIGEKVGDKFIVNITKYSVTTSKHLHYLKLNLLGRDNVAYTTKHVPIGSQSLKEYV